MGISEGNQNPLLGSVRWIGAWEDQPQGEPLLPCIPKAVLLHPSFLPPSTGPSKISRMVTDRVLRTYQGVKGMAPGGWADEAVRSSVATGCELWTTLALSGWVWMATTTTANLVGTRFSRKVARPGARQMCLPPLHLGELINWSKHVEQ